MFSRRPVKKLSRQSTSCPSANKRSHKCEPMNPAPPVTNTRKVFRNASDRYNHSVASNIGKRVFGVNKRSRKTKIANYSIQPVAYWCERLNTIRFRLLYV